MALRVDGHSDAPGSLIWKLSTDLRVLDAPISLVAVLSNVVVSAAGVLYFAAVRNATVAGSPRGGDWERILLAVDGSSGNVLWMYPSAGDLLDPSPRLRSGEDLQLLSLSLAQAALVFCGTRPKNSSIVGDVGIGAVDLAGGDLVSGCAPARQRSSPYDSSTLAPLRLCAPRAPQCAPNDDFLKINNL